jgi:CHAT domain-containing protein
VPATTPGIVVFADPIEGPLRAASAQLHPSPGARWADGLFSLPSSRTEAAGIARIFATHKVKSYLGPAATTQVLLSREVRAASVLHIATHGYFSDATPDIVGLATSGSAGVGGGFLGLTELFTERFSSRLVVISGCETMRGKDYNGWGVRSLADGFVTQGAGSVVGALWSISDVGTAELMEAFYASLHRSDGNSSLALSVAQRLLAESRRLYDPYFWAGIVLESTNRSFDQRAL